MQRSVQLSNCTEVSCLLIHLPHRSMYLKIVGVQNVFLHSHPCTAKSNFHLFTLLKSATHQVFSPVTQTICCVIPCCSYFWTVLCAPLRDNSNAADKSLVALSFRESAPSRVLHSCLSVPTYRCDHRLEATHCTVTTHLSQEALCLHGATMIRP